MSRKQINILLVPSDLAGVGHYRSIWPGQEINRKHPEDFRVEIDHMPDFGNIEFFKQFDIIHFHRQLGPYDRQESFIKELRESGVIVIMDLDDYWMPPKEHPMYGAAMQEKLPEKITSTFRMVDYVTTTTDIFANHISKYNSNVHIVPNAIDMKHPMWKSENTKVGDKVRVSWIGGSCLHEDMEILTDEGFKFVKDLNQNEKVACLDPETGHFEFNKPKGYIKVPFKGKLNCGKNRLVDYAVTPNHNMFVSVPKSLTEKTLDFRLVQSEKVHSKDMHFKKDALWIGKEQSKFTLSGIYQRSDNQVLVTENVKGNSIWETDFSVEKYFDDLVLDMDLWLKFFGFWLAEGWTTSTLGLFQVGVAQTKNNGYLEEMFHTLEQLGFNPTYTKDLKQVRVFDKRLWNYLAAFGKAADKYIPSEILALSPRQLNILLEWFLKGDGSQEKGGKRFDKRKTKKGETRGAVQYNSSRKRGYTISKRLADNIQEICLKTGVVSTITNRGKRDSVMSDGRKINARHDCYTISIGSNGIRSRKTPLLRSEDQYQEDYNGFVYCVEVSNNIIYVRRNGKTFWIGNSHMKDLELLKSSMNILHNDESLKGKYQIVMCGYDVRGFITEVDQKGNVIQNRKIHPHETIWNKFEEVFTDNYNPNLIPEGYRNHLLKYENTTFKDFDVYGSGYVRRWTLPLTQYGKHYNYCDVCLAPLAENTFNEVKSELKIIEAGLTKKVLIAQEFGIYKELIENGKNGILIPKNKNLRGWYEAIKKVVNDKDYREELSNNLYDFVRQKYTLEIVTEKRTEWYREILENRKSVHLLEGVATHSI
jgi:hypothetical protein